MSSEDMSGVPPRVFTSFEELAGVYVVELPRESEPSIYLKPNIPEKKLKKAIKAYAPELAPDEVLAMWDSTVFGSGKAGCLITEQCFYFNQAMDKPWVIPYPDIQGISVEEDEDNIPWLKIDMPDRQIAENDGFEMKLHELRDFLMAAKNYHPKA